MHLIFGISPPQVVFCRSYRRLSHRCRILTPTGSFLVLTGDLSLISCVLQCPLVQHHLRFVHTRAGVGDRTVNLTARTTFRTRSDLHTTSSGGGTGTDVGGWCNGGSAGGIAAAATPAGLLSKGQRSVTFTHCLVQNSTVSSF